MSAVPTSILVDARHAPGFAPGAVGPGEQWLVAGPGHPIGLPAHAEEREVFLALVSRASGQLCVWLRAGDRPHADRLARLRSAVVTLGTPVVGHALASTPGRRSGGQGRLPPAAVLGALDPDTLAFRRDVARFADASAPEGTRRSLALWATTQGGVGWVDAVLLDAAPRGLPDAPLAREEALARRVQAAHAAMTQAPPALVGRAAQQLVVAVEEWTAHRGGMEAGGRRLWWREPEEARAQPADDPTQRSRKSKS